MANVAGSASSHWKTAPDSEAAHAAADIPGQIVDGQAAVPAGD